MLARDYVIVGGGISAVSALEELVRVLADEDPSAGRESVTITLMHPAPTLVRVAGITKHSEQLEEVTALGAVPASALVHSLNEMIPEEARARLRVQAVRGMIVGLDSTNKEALYTPTDDATASPAQPSAASSSVSPLRLKYSKLCLCTGARPSLFLPPESTPAVLPPELIVIRDAASLDRLSAAISTPAPGGRAKRVAIVGNGGIALELVHALQTSQVNQTINTSDAVAPAVTAAAAANANADDSEMKQAASTASSLTVAAPTLAPSATAVLPPLHVDWIVSHGFMGSTFLDPMASAFLMPQLFADKDPERPAIKAEGNAAAAPVGGTKDATNAHAAAAVGESKSEERMQDAPEADANVSVSAPRANRHVRTVLHDPAGLLAASASAASSASTAAVASSASSLAPAASSAAPASATGVAVGAALGPNWLNQLYADTNIPKYVLERERADKQADAAATASVAAAPSPAPPAFDLSLHLGAEVSALTLHPAGSDAALGLDLTTGTHLACDLVVSAVGVQPNTEWTRSRFCSGPLLALEADGGIRIDESMRSSLEGVYAAGDCSTLVFSPAYLAANGHTSDDRPCLWFPLRLWSHAKTLGLYAARALSSIFDTELAELGGFNFMLFAHTTTLFGKKVVLLGRFNLQGWTESQIETMRASGQLRTLVRCKPEAREEFLKLHLLCGRLIGAVLIGDSQGETMDLEETFENLILNQTQLEGYGDFLNEVQVDLADYFD